MEKNKFYYIPVGSKKEYRKLKFLLTSIGETVMDEDYHESYSYLGQGVVDGYTWELLYKNSELEPLTINDILDLVVKALPKPKKDKSEVKQDNAPVKEALPYPFNESAVRVKNKAQLVDVMGRMGFNKDDADIVVDLAVPTMFSFDDLCVSLDTSSVAQCGRRGNGVYTPAFGTQDAFRKKEYYIMEYNNFIRRDTIALK